MPKTSGNLFILSCQKYQLYITLNFFFLKKTDSIFFNIVKGLLY